MNPEIKEHSLTFEQADILAPDLMYQICGDRVDDVIKEKDVQFVVYRGESGRLSLVYFRISSDKDKILVALKTKLIDEDETDIEEILRDLDVLGCLDFDESSKQINHAFIASHGGFTEISERDNAALFADQLSKLEEYTPEAEKSEALG